MEAENNKIIAEFMGKEVITELQFLSYEVEDLENKFIDTNLKYHSDWNWLMEVVEKIENRNLNKMGIVTLYGLGRTQIKCYIGDYLVHEIDIMNKSSIEVTYLAIVDFIKWYNQQKLKWIN